MRKQKKTAGAAASGGISGLSEALWTRDMHHQVTTARNKPSTPLDRMVLRLARDQRVAPSVAADTIIDIALERASSGNYQLINMLQRIAP